MNLLFLADNPWTGLYQRPQHLAARLMRHWPVLWIEPVTMAHRVAWRPRKVEANLHTLSLPMFPLNARNHPVRRLARLVSAPRLNRRALLSLQVARLRHALRVLKIDGGEIAFFIENFQLIGLVSHFAPRVVAFDYIDDAFGFTDFPAFVREAWRETIGRADIITATSEPLKRLMEAERPACVHLVRNGVEFARFAAGAAMPRPDDLPSDKKPLVGYVGSVYPWLDYDLIESLLLGRPDINFVVIGREHPSVRDRLGVLARHANFRFLGYRPYARIPAYLGHFDAGIIPFLHTRLTEGVNPVKLYEYSAAGVPAVATDFSADLAGFRDVLFLARSREEFASQLARAVAQRHDPASTDRLRAFAKQNDWNDRAEAIEALITQHCQDTHSREESS